MWYVPGENGWGVNVVQSDDFLFVTFFIYGADNKPTWYTAQLTLDASGNYNGKLYATTGTYYASPWKASDQTTTAVGTASFQPTSAYTAKLIYVVTTPAHAGGDGHQVVQRQTLTRITIGGTYIGAQSGAYSGCSNGSDNGGYSDLFNLDVDRPPAVRSRSRSTSRVCVHVLGITHAIRATLPDTYHGLRLRRRPEHQRVDDGDKGHLARDRGQALGRRPSGEAAGRTRHSLRCSTSTSPGPLRGRALVTRVAGAYIGIPSILAEGTI